MLLFNKSGSSGWTGDWEDALVIIFQRIAFEL
jgi:hypothetical protein